MVKDGRPSDNLIEAFVKASRQLEAQGAIALTSTCGFLISIQDEIASAVSIPVLVSALSMHGDLRLTHQHGPIGIITASKAALGDRALAAAGIKRGDVIIEGMEDCPAFADAILRPKNRQARLISSDLIEREIVSKAQTMLAQHPDIEAFLLECGNLPPYKEAIILGDG